MYRNIKRWLCGILVFGLLFTSAFPVNASISTERADASYNGFVYKYDNYRRVEITRYTGEATSVKVPAKVNGKKVVNVTIDSKTKKLKKITISKNVLRCSLNAAPALTGVRVASTNPYICAQNNYVLTKDKKVLLTVPGARKIMDNIPDGVKVIEDYSCEGSKVEKLVLGKNVQEIGVCAFRNCTDLKTVVINAKLQYIDGSAFQGCTLLKTINIRKNILEVVSGAFRDSGLEKAIIRNPKCYIGTNAFPKDTVIYGYKGSTAEKYALFNGNRFVVLD